MAIEEYRNRHEGERIFVIGNGPSLAQTPLHRLEDEYTFGVNNIANIFDRTEWRPSFFLAAHSPPNIPKGNVMEVVDQNIPSFLPRDRLDYVPDRTNVERFDIEHLSTKEDVDISDYSINWESVDHYRDVWSVDISEVVYQYTTILYPAMQIADYMGFSEIYLLGCDLYDEWNLHMVFGDGDDPASYQSEYDSKVRRVLDFVAASERPVRSAVNGAAFQFLNSPIFRRIQPVLKEVDEKFANRAHFYDTYEVGDFPVGNHQRNEQMRRSHRLARKTASERDFSIYNATLGGSLEVYPRVDLRELLAP